MNGKNIILACLATVLAAACSKAPAGDTTGDETVYCEPIPVTIEVGIGKEDPETRMAYTLSGNTLKSSWNKGDQISLVTYGQNYKLMTNDILTAEASGTSVKFKGTYSNPHIIGGSVRTGVEIIYPAFSGEPLATPKELYNDYNAYGPLYVGSDKYLYFDADRKFVQHSDGDLTNLPYYTIINGVVDHDILSSTGRFNSNLHQCTYIIKANLTLPDKNPAGNVDFTLTSARFEVVRIDVPSSVPHLIGSGSTDFNRFSYGFIGGKPYLETYFNKIGSDGESVGLTFKRGSTITVYFVGGLTYDIPKIFNDPAWQIKIMLYRKDNPETPICITRNKVNVGEFFDGRMYTLNADLNNADGLFSIDPSDMDMSFYNPFGSSETILN